MNLHSPLLIIHAHQRRREVLVAVVGPFSEGAGAEVVINVVDGVAPSSALGGGAANKGATMISVEGEEAVAEGLAGKIMTSLNETETPRSTLNLTGTCWKKLILID